jgi:hypothetical protein
MAYLQRQNAQRLLEGVRTAELARLQVERDITESRLAATQAQVDPEAVLKQLATIRDLFCVGHPDAAEALEALIRMLRAGVTQSDNYSARARRL